MVILPGDKSKGEKLLKLERKPSTKIAMEAKDTTISEKYKEYLGNKYKEDLIKYKSISDRGLDIDEYLYLREKATYIMHILGEVRKKVYSEEVYYHYYNYGLIIEGNEDLKIYFNGTLVLGEDVFIPGKWEEVLDEVYVNSGKMFDEKQRKQQAKSDVIYIASKIKEDNAVLEINDNVYLEKFDKYDNKDEYISKGVVVREKGAIVFSYIKCGFRYEDGLSVKNRYTKGNWEKVIRKYAYDMRIEEYNKAKEMNDSLVEEELKRIRSEYK